MGSSDVDFFIHSYYEFKLFGVTLSINTTMVTTVIVCLILLALILFARHEIMKDYDEPNVVQNVVEMIVEKMDAMVVSNMGIHAKKYLNYVEALMAFIFLSNISGLFGLRPPTADFGTTFGLALITFVMIEYAWIKTKGFGIIKDLLDPFPVFLPINIISEFATPVSMSLRLFGNVTARNDYARPVVRIDAVVYKDWNTGISTCIFRFLFWSNPDICIWNVNNGIHIKPL